MWLDDVREPWKHGCVGWTWVKTAQEAIELLKTGKVEEASLDHDLSIAAQEYYCSTGILWDKEETGYDVCVFLEEHYGLYPPQGVHVHTANPVGRIRMEKALERARQRLKEHFKQERE